MELNTLLSGAAMAITAMAAAAGGVPEPASWALMLTGFLGAGATLRAKRRQRAFAAA